MHAMTARLQHEAESWCSISRSQTALVNPAAAVSALGELTPGGALMKGFEEESLARECWNESTSTQIP
jgi:transcription initiation factor TFIIH subunit 1